MVASLIGHMLNPECKVLFSYSKDWSPAATLGLQKAPGPDLDLRQRSSLTP